MAERAVLVRPRGRAAGSTGGIGGRRTSGGRVSRGRPGPGGPGAGRPAPQEGPARRPAEGAKTPEQIARAWAAQLERKRPGPRRLRPRPPGGEHRAGPVWQPRLDPVSELILTILSANSADINAEAAFAALRDRYPSAPAPSGASHGAAPLPRLGRPRPAGPAPARLVGRRGRPAGRADRRHPPGRARPPEGAAHPRRPAAPWPTSAAATRWSSCATCRPWRRATGWPPSRASARRPPRWCCSSASARRSCRSIDTSTASASASA